MAKSPLGKFEQVNSKNAFFTNEARQQLCHFWAKPRNQPVPSKGPDKLDKNVKRGVKMFEQDREAARA